MDRSLYTAATKAAQVVMSAERSDLVADGKWGKFTQAAYEGVSGPLQSKVDAAIQAVAPGVTAAQLARFRDKERAAAVLQQTAPYTPYTDTVDEAIRLAAKESGIDVAVLRRFAYIESRYNPKAKNGSSRGLMQMQPAAWADASKYIILPPYKEAVWDALQNARAGAAYINNNRKVLTRLGYTGPWDVAHMYLAHQQGAGGLLNMWKAANGQPSKISVANMEKNPPQDKKGVTTDPVQFYNR